MHKLFVLILVIFSLSFSSKAQVNHWESVILEGDEWRYLLPESQPSDEWTGQAFDDSSWTVGTSGFGYGDGDDKTLLTEGTLSVYIRKSFNIIDVTAIDQLYLHMDYDDGFVAYLNGVEIARDQMSGNPPQFDQPADGLHEAVLYSGGTPELFEIDIALLKEGNNVLAVEVHNESTTSSDLSTIPILSLGINDESKNYFPTPSWFQVPVDVNFTSSNLPIIVINTEGGAEIPDEPKVLATMKIIYRGEGERTFLTDEEDESFLDYSGDIGIEIRGSSSQLLPKKQYGFTTYEEGSTESDNVSLLDMPKENDWILNGLAFDPSLIRDYLSYNLSREIGQYATRTQYCEVVINGAYSGLYVLQEKMKADGDRIDINKMDPDDNALPELSGGYITKADKTTGGDPIAWSMPSYSGGVADFIHTSPKPEDVTEAQTDYIQSVFENLRIASLNKNSSLTDGYPSIIDIPSFVDFMIISELTSNVDAYQFSTYFHKDRNGKLRAGPVWDLNLTFGNDLFQFGLDRSHTDVWQFDLDNRGATFWRDLFEEDDFKCYLSRRWNELTQEGKPLHLACLENFIDETVATISEATVREQATWGTVENNATEIENMKTWLSERITWMTRELGSFSTCDNVTTPSLVISKIYYNPLNPDESLGFDDSDYEFIELHNNGTSAIDLTGIYIGGTGLVYQFPANTMIAPDQRIMLANDIPAFVQSFGGPPFGEFSRSLSNGGQTISLLDGFGNVIDMVTYDDKEPWPENADGDGFYLSLTNSGLDNNDPANWTSEIPDFDFTVVLNTPDADSEITIYPNPAKSHINIQGKQIIRKITLMTVDGKIAYQDSPLTHNHQIQLPETPTGFYFLIVKYQGNVVVKKVVVEK